MRIVTEQNTFISPIDEYKKIQNFQLITYASSGYGKGLISEGIVQWCHKHGYIILVIADPKYEVEYGFQMFIPEERYHLDHLAKISSIVGAWKLPGRENVKIYHPFTFDLPVGRMLPEMNIFTIPIKSLGRAEWGMLAEVHGENETVSSLLKASEETSNEDGIYSFAHYIQDSVKGKSTNKRRKADWNNFGLDVGSGGTAKDVSNVTRSLRPFKKHFFLSKQNCDYNLDWKDILTDQKNYHVFVSNYIGRSEEKLTDFLVLYLFESILRNKQYLKHPILIVIPEISKLCPFKPLGHKEFLSESIKKNLKTIRSEGRGMSSVLDSQVWGDVDEDVRGSSTIQLLGHLGDPKDVENLCKALGYSKNIKDQLSKPEIDRTYLIRGIKGASPEDGGYMFFYPRAMHKESNYNFEEMYREHNRKNPEEYPMKSYKEMYDKMKKIFDDEETKLKEKIKRREKEWEQQEKQKHIEKEKNKEETKPDAKISKLKQKGEESKEKTMKLCYDMFNDETLDKSERSFRKIAEKFGIKSHKTVGKYIKNYSKKLEEGNTEKIDAEPQAEEEVDTL